MEDFEWTLGAQDGLRHRNYVNAGTFGEVHQVRPTSANTDVEDSEQREHGNFGELACADNSSSQGKYFTPAFGKI